MDDATNETADGTAANAVNAANAAEPKRAKRRMLPAIAVAGTAAVVLVAGACAFPATVYTPAYSGMNTVLANQVDNGYRSLMRTISVKLPAKHIITVAAAGTDGMLTAVDDAQASSTADASSSTSATADTASSATTARTGGIATMAARAVVAPDAHSLKQQWMVMSHDDGSSTLMSVAGNKVLAVGDESRWSVFHAEDGAYTFLSSSDPSKALSLTGDSATLVDAGDSRETPSVAVFDVTEMRERQDALAKANASAVASGSYFIVPASQANEPESFLSSTEEGLVSLGDKSRGDSRKWQLKVDEAGYAVLSHPVDGTVLGVDAEVPISHAAVALQSPGTTASQQWIVVPDESGSGFLLESAAWEGLYLDFTQTKAGDAVAAVMPRDAARGQSWAFAKGVTNKEAAQHFADIAMAEVNAGYEDGTRNEGGSKYWSRFANSYDAWCSEFVGWCMVEAGLEPGKNMPAEPVVSSEYLDYYRDHPEFGTVHANDGSYRPQVGDIELDGSDLHHTCLVSDVYDDEYYVAEGNIGDKTTHGQRNYDHEAEYYITINWEACLAE